MHLGYNKRPKIKDADGNIIGSGAEMIFDFAERVNDQIQFKLMPNIYDLRPSLSPTENEMNIIIEGSNLNPQTTFTIDDVNVLNSWYVHSGYWVLRISTLLEIGKKKITINNGSTVVFSGWFEIKNGNIIIHSPSEWSIPGNVSTDENGLTTLDRLGGNNNILNTVLPLNFQIDFRFQPSANSAYDATYLMKTDLSTISGKAYIDSMSQYAMPQVWRRYANEITHLQNGILTQVTYTAEDLYFKTVLQGGSVMDLVITELI